MRKTTEQAISQTGKAVKPTTGHPANRPEVIVVEGVEITVIKKKIKNIYLRILPPDGRAQITAPVWASSRQIENFARSRLGWIAKQSERVASRPQFQPQEYVSGERVFLWGREYLLEVAETDGRPSVRVDVWAQDEEVGRILLTVKKGATAQQRGAVLENWYRAVLKQAVPLVLEKCQRVTGLTAKEWHIKKMKTRWGSCNTAHARIWLNLRLVLMPPECLEYVITHELVHLLEPGHNKRFYGFMDAFYPGWKEVRKRMKGM